MASSSGPDGTIQHYRDLLEINRLITSSLDRGVVLSTVTEQATRLLVADAAALLVREHETLRIAAAYNIGVATDELRLPLGPGQMKAIRDLGRVTGLEGCVGVPLVLRGEIVGVLAVFRREPEAPSSDDEQLLSALADQAAVALDNARIYRQSQAQAAAIRESEERFRLALDEAPIGVALVGTDGRFLRVNNVLCEIVGYAREELTNLTFQEITHPADLDTDVRLVHQLARGEIARYQLPKRYIRKDGTLVDIVLSASVVRGLDGAPLYFIAHVEDVTERNRAEARIRAVQQRFELALEGADLAAWDWNIATGAVVFNARWAEMRGLRFDELRPHVDTWTSGVHPDDLPGVQRVLDAHLQGRGDYETEHRVRTASGDWIWVLDRGKVIARDERGRPLRMVGTELDVTERKRAERERERLHRRLEIVLAEAPVGILLTHDGRSWHANGRAQALFERRIDTSVDPSDFLTAVLDPSGQPVPLEQFPGVRALRGEKLEGVEMRLRRPTLPVVPVLVNAAPIPPDETDQPGAVVTFEDISSHKELERLRTEWSSLIAHDLRQPLSSITLSAEFIAAQATNSPMVQRRIQQISDSARRLGRMVQDLLDFSRLEARQLQLHRDVLDLGELVRRITERFRAEVPDRSLGLRVRGAPVSVDVDPDRFEQIMENLLTNAIKYGDPDTPILVEVVPVDDTVTVAVTNYGAGIAPEHLSHLFRRFHTIEEARRLGTKGIGLGLYITHELVAAHGGWITVESTPGGATTFRFTLPVVARTATTAHVGP